ncbi:hypothetical protein L596_014105 [Steinernema carpocapsae]|uniref:non-specific serine/threonine protein kinase n=1 Tax=Steinernema carpocapsae TaxID=34508 RepID=A0A4U5NBW3_STECR|nr:hypothetical protein L596_014105 [Steinernema carpocapsae]
MPPKKKSAAKLYQMAVDVPVGTQVGNFVVGKQFAKGGFGKIYEGTSAKEPGQKVVIKIEPAENGPLFTEISAFIRCLKPPMLADWKKEQQLDFLGLPEYLGSGTFEHKGEQMRFLAMPKYACSMEHLRAEKLPEDVLKVTKSMLISLDYLHKNDFVHADVKADNILMEEPARFDRTILVDFGLSRRIPDPKEKPDPKKAHNGTAIFTSTDAHRGCAPSFRGDIEILAYNIIYWITGSLPWQSYETQLEKVAGAKTKLVSEKLKALEKEFGMAGAMARFVAELLKVAEDCPYEEKPDFERLFEFLKEAAKGVKSELAARRRTRVSLALRASATPKRGTKKAKSPISAGRAVQKASVGRSKKRKAKDDKPDDLNVSRSVRSSARLANKSASSTPAPVAVKMTETPRSTGRKHTRRQLQMSEGSNSYTKSSEEKSSSSEEKTSSFVENTTSSEGKSSSSEEKSSCSSSELSDSSDIYETPLREPLSTAITPNTKTKLGSRIPGVQNMQNVRRSVYQRIAPKYGRTPCSLK